MDEKAIENEAMHNIPLFYGMTLPVQQQQQQDDQEPYPIKKARTSEASQPLSPATPQAILDAFGNDNNSSDCGDVVGGMTTMGIKGNDDTARTTRIINQENGISNINNGTTTTTRVTAPITTAVTSTSVNNVSTTGIVAKSSKSSKISLKQSSGSDSSTIDEEYLRKLGILPSLKKMAKGVCKPCDPTAGLTLGGVPITKEKLAMLTPDDLDEHVLMQNGEPLSISKMADLLGFGDLDDDDDWEGGIVGLIENNLL